MFIYCKCYVMILSINIKLIKQVHQKIGIFATIGISEVIVLTFNQMFAIDVMIY